MWHRSGKPRPIPSQCRRGKRLLRNPRRSMSISGQRLYSQRLSRRLRRPVAAARF